MAIVQTRRSEAVSDLRVGGEQCRVYSNGPARAPAVQEDPVLLAVVIPTYNEKENIPLLLFKLEPVLKNIRHEIVFVDDNSPDGTAALIRSVAQTSKPLRVIQRIGRRGLSSACIEGILSCSAEYIAVMDADLQHDESILLEMLSKLVDEHLDIVIGSRNIRGGGIGSGMNDRRVLLSKTGRRLSDFIHGGRLSDPMSGFFIVRRSFFMKIAPRLSGVGFKILLDIFLTCGGDVRMGEVPYHFRKRQHGRSKLDVLVGVEYFELLTDKIIGNYISFRFLLFGSIGACGAVLQAAILYPLLRMQHLTFLKAQLIATAIVMVVNYTLNNIVSYRDRRRRGIRYWTGLVGFCITCSFGVMANFSIAHEALQRGIAWPLAAVIGLLFGAIWNYGVTSIAIWHEDNWPAWALSKGARSLAVASLGNINKDAIAANAASAERMESAATALPTVPAE